MRPGIVCDNGGRIVGVEGFVGGEFFWGEVALDGGGEDVVYRRFN